MYELVQVGERTYYINCPAKIGIYKINESDVCLIDSGNDKEAGKKVLKVLAENGMKPACIINTHSNADHIGGNSLLQERAGCEVLATGIESAFTRYPALEAAFLYGGYPSRDLRNKFLLAPASEPSGIIEAGLRPSGPQQGGLHQAGPRRDGPQQDAPHRGSLPAGLEAVRLGGHFFDMVGIWTSDNIYFLADCVFGEETISKYHIFFIYDVKEFLKTLDYIETLDGRLYIPSHAGAVQDIRPLAEANRKKVYEITDRILDFCKEPTDFEGLLKLLFDHYGLTMDFNQYVLVGSTIRSYLSYLRDEGRVDVSFLENRLLWQAIK